ncbi:hypothetical protein [Streptomyces sp. NPDC002328]|uniref:hypothetical protein n=1 Tax=Streptomyces sp. NPDC002328 TaxID=3364642 RepID=UPI0036C4E9AA
MATSRGKRRWFVGVSVLAVVLLLLLVRSCGEDCEDEGVAATPKVTTTVVVTATPSPVGSQIGELVDAALMRVKQTGLSVAAHDASDLDETPAADWRVCFEKVTLSQVEFAAVAPGAPCPDKDGKPIPWPKMPAVKGVTYGKAVEMLGADVGPVVLEAAYQDEYGYDQDNKFGDFADWKVCFQSIGPGQVLKDRPGITLHAVEKGGACPSNKGQYKDPTNNPAYADPAPGSDSGSSDADRSGSGGSGSGESDSYPGDKGGCPPGGCYNPCPPGGCR